MRAADLLCKSTDGRGCCLRRIWGEADPQYSQGRASLDVWPSGGLIREMLNTAWRAEDEVPKYAGHPGEGRGLNYSGRWRKRESVKMDKGTIIESEVGKPWKGKSHTCISCSLLTPAGRKISSQTSNNELPTTCSWWRQPQYNSLLSSMKQPPLLCALDLPMVCHRILVHNLVTKQHLDPLLVLGASHI